MKKPSSRAAKKEKISATKAFHIGVYKPGHIAVEGTVTI
jgi:hypothetical protein